MSIMENIKAHYSGIRSELRTIDVPEWGDGAESLVIYYRPMNLQEQDMIFKYVQDKSLKSLAQTLIVRALNKDGAKLFRPADMMELMKHADADVIERICIEMGGRDDAGDAAKN